MSATYLAVRYQDREQAKSLGARWDQTAKSWFVPEGLSTEPFRQWLYPTIPVDPRDQFANELRNAGFYINDPHPIMDGQIHRCAVGGDIKEERNGTYRGFLDGVPNGWHQNFKVEGAPVRWTATTTERMTAPARAEIASGAAAKLRQDEVKRMQNAEQAAIRATAILLGASPATSHPYLTDKQVSPYGLFIAAPGTSIETEDGKKINISGRLLVPIRDAKRALMSLQIIDDVGRKMFLPGGKVSGGQHVIGDINSPWPLGVGEGYANCATVHEATGQTIVVAFTAHNLGIVAAQHRAESLKRSIFISGDNDHHLPLQLDMQGRPKHNVGLEAANAAAAVIDGYALIPEPIDHGPEGKGRGTDWNDVMKHRGMAAVQRELAAGQAAGMRIKITRNWRLTARAASRWSRPMRGMWSMPDKSCSGGCSWVYPALAALFATCSAFFWIVSAFVSLRSKETDAGSDRSRNILSELKSVCKSSLMSNGMAALFSAVAALAQVFSIFFH